MEVRKRGTRRAENELYVIPRCIDIAIIELKVEQEGKDKGDTFSCTNRILQYFFQQSTMQTIEKVQGTDLFPLS
jgi:hypothetical protein